MRNKKWKTYDGKRYASVEKTRCQRRFRHHARTPHNPDGRIRREPCFQHPYWSEGEAHHPDYSKPFAVIWCCPSCHRKLENGTLRFRPQRDVWDYSSLVEQHVGRHKETVGHTPRDDDSDVSTVPF
jgi:hypothetical protein